MKRKKILLFIVSLLFIQYLFYLLVHYFDTKNIQNIIDKKIINQELKKGYNSNLGFINKKTQETKEEKIAKLKIEKLDEMNKNITNFRFSSEDNSKIFLNYICKNNNLLKKFVIENYSKDKDINSFLLKRVCYNKMINSMLDLSIIDNKDVRNYFYNNCWINKSEIEGNWYFWGKLESSNLIIAGYYLWYINKEDTVVNLNRLNLFLNKDNEKYFLENEKEYSKLYYDILTWVNYTDENCDKIYIVNYEKEINKVQ